MDRPGRVGTGTRTYDRQGREIDRPSAGTAHLSREAAERQLDTLAGRTLCEGTGDGIIRFEYWVEAVPIDL